jgi:hypothetical protein
MKSLSLLATISLALSVSAASQNLQQNSLFGGSRRGFGNNNSNFFGGGVGRNGQNSNQNGKNVNNANANKGNQNKGNQTKGNQNNNNNKNNNGKNNGGAASAASVAATTAAAASTSTAAAASANSAAAAASSGGNSADAQSSTTLDPAVIATGFENNGQDVPEAGQVASLTSSNNFINFCLTQPNLPITNGKQITTGSCNPAPMGAIPSTDNMPSAKFQVPKNGDTLPQNTPFTISMAVANFETGNFVNAQENYFAAPQQLNSAGQIVGHSHVVVEQLSALDQTTPTDPRKFAFFKGLNAAAVNGVLTADVTSGLPAGFYKVSSINTAANHQPVLVPIAQHGSLDDVAYFTVSSSEGPATPPPAASSAAAAATSVAASSASSAAAAAAPAATTAAAAAGKAQGGKQQQKGQQQKGGKQQQQQQQKGGKQQNKGRQHARAFF